MDYCCFLFPGFLFTYMLREIKETLLEEFHFNFFFLITEQVGANFESIEKQKKKLYHGVSGFESWFSIIP